MKFRYIANEHEDPEVKGVDFFGIYFERNGPAIEVDKDHIAYKYLPGNGQFEKVEEEVKERPILKVKKVKNVHLPADN